MKNLYILVMASLLPNMAIAQSVPNEQNLSTETTLEDLKNNPDIVGLQDDDENKTEINKPIETKKENKIKEPEVHKKFLFKKTILTEQILKQYKERRQQKFENKNAKFFPSNSDMEKQDIEKALGN